MVPLSLVLEHVGSIHLQSLECAPVTGSDIDPPSSGPALEVSHRFIRYIPVTIVTVNPKVIAAPSACPALAKTAGLPPEVGVVNRGVVELETGRAAGISVRIAEDLANVIDDGSTRRVLPIIGKGALQNITDLKLLRGVDMAILQSDVLDYARQQNLFPSLG